MVHYYTEKQIIQFIYKECDIFDKFEMEFALEDDSTLLESYELLIQGYRNLPNVLFSPQKASIDKILEYSHNEIN